MDEYFKFVESRIRNHWHANAKAASHALGFDIKYDQLRQVTSGSHARSDPPFLLGYFKRNRMLLIHIIRKNVIKCAISEMIAQQRNVWHNYGNTKIDRTYSINPEDCLGRARLIVRSRLEFELMSQGCQLIEAGYKELAEAIAGARNEQIGEELPLRDIAQALSVPPSFS